MFSNLTFLNTTFLFTLFASLIPLLIYLLNRQKAKRVSFSNLTFLKELQKDRMRKIKLKQWLLLILRTLIIFFVALSLARPAIKGTLAKGVSAHARTSVALLLDHSCSMSYETNEGTLLDLAKTKALEIVELLKEEDEIYFVPFTDEPNTTFSEPTSHFVMIKKAIGALEPTYRSTDVRRALEYAVTLLQGAKNLNKEIYLLTDRTANGWKTFKDAETLQAEGITFYIIDLSSPERRNISVDGARIPNQILMQGKPFSVEGLITNHAKEDVNACSVELYLERERVRQNTLDLEPGQHQRTVFYARPEHAGRFSGYTEIVESSVGQDDRLLMDNRAYFSVDIPRQAHVLLIGHDAQDTYFLKRALNPENDPEAFVQVSETTLGSFATRDVQGKDVIILSNVPRLSSLQLQSIQQHVANGGGLILCLGPDVDPRFYNNRLLPGILPIKLKSTLGHPNRKEAYHSWDRLDFEHPIFKGLLEQDRLDSPHFYVIYDAIVPPEVHPIVHYTGGSVAFAESRFSQGICVLLTSALRLDWTDLPLKGIFVPMLYRTVQYLATKLAVQKPILVGQTLDRPLRTDLSQKSVHLEHPMGDRMAIMPTMTRDGYVVHLETLDYPGIWRLFSGDEEVDRFAVNLRPEESQAEIIEEKRIEKTFGGHRPNILSRSAVMEKEILQSRYGRELWKGCLGLAFVLMIAEMLIAYTRKNEVAA